MGLLIIDKGAAFTRVRYFPSYNQEFPFDMIDAGIFQNPFNPWQLINIKSASTHPFSIPWRKRFESALAPVRRIKASIMADFPDPVSPDKTLKPSSRQISAF